VESLEEGQSLLYHGDVYNTDEDFEVKGAYSGSRMGGGWPSFGGKSGLRGSATDIMIKSGKLIVIALHRVGCVGKLETRDAAAGGRGMLAMLNHMMI
jgi:hypothetical protein